MFSIYLRYTVDEDFELDSDDYATLEEAKMELEDLVYDGVSFYRAQIRNAAGEVVETASMTPERWESAFVNWL